MSQCLLVVCANFSHDIVVHAIEPHFLAKAHVTDQFVVVLITSVDNRQLFFVLQLDLQLPLLQYPQNSRQRNDKRNKNDI